MEKQGGPAKRKREERGREKSESEEEIG